MSYEVLLPLLAVLGVLAFFFIAVVAAGLWEKRPMQPYYIPAAGEEYQPSATAAAANTQAEALGFRHVVLCHDGKGKLYRVRYDFWTAPDNTAFVIVGSGSVAGVPVDGVSFYSRREDGRVLCTTNYSGDQDISGAEEQVTWPRMPFAPLLRKHAQRLAEVAVEPFKTDSALAEYFDIRRSKADVLVARGYAYYLDDERLVWRYTLKGAVVLYAIGVWVRPVRRFLRSIGLVRP